MSIAWREALEADADADGNVSVSAQDLQMVDEDLKGQRSRVAELERALDEAVESVRLHERQAEDRRDITAALEWRVEAQRLENMLGSFA